MRNSLRLGTQLTLAFGLVLCLSAGLALTGMGMLSSVMGGFREVSSDILPKTNIANQNIQAAYDYARAFAFIVTSAGRADADSSALASAKTILADTVKLVNDNTALLEKSFLPIRKKPYWQKSSSNAKPMAPVAIVYWNCKKVATMAKPST